jgi:hypothetical protein
MILVSDILRTMLMRPAPLSILAILLISCSSPPKPAVTEPVKAEAPKPSDESAVFSKPNLAETKVVDKELLGKAFMPGGTLAHYKKGKKEYDMFVARLPTPTDAALLLLDWHKALADSKLVPSFGGYFGQDAGRPVFVFSKGAWIAGIAGLPEKEADLEGRTLASHLN